ncbi:MAG: hypothetical protein AMXMBFR47_10870 [Planctomycetota bacterium]
MLLIWRGIQQTMRKMAHIRACVPLGILEVPGPFNKATSAAHEPARPILDTRGRERYIRPGIWRTGCLARVHRIRRIATILAVCLAVSSAARGYAQSPQNTATQSATPAAGANIDSAAPDGQATSAPASQPTANVPPISAAPRRLPPLHFDELTFDLGLDGSWREQNTQAEYRGRYGIGRREYEQRNRAQEYRETAGARGSGNLLGPDVARYQFDVRFGLDQERYTETRPGRDLFSEADGTLLEYDTRISLLPSGKLSGNLFASQLDDRLPRMFLPSLDRHRERYGAEIMFNDRVLPMRLTYEDEFERLDGPGRRSYDDQESDDRSLRYEAAWQPSETHQLRLSYEYTDREDRYAGADSRFDTTRNYLTLNHDLRFGPSDRSQLNTIARFQDESGDLARDAFELAPRLRLQHTDAFSTNYGFQFLRDRFEGTTIDRERGDIGATYVFDKSLTTSLSAYAFNEDADRGEDTLEGGATWNTSFARDNAIGRFSANLNLNYAHVRNDSDSRDGIVIQESHTLRDPLPVFLAHDNVRPLSVVVTDSGGRRVFFPGVDYLLLRSGRYTALYRVPTGNITDGQTVLVNYRYRTDENYELDRQRADFRVQQEFGDGFAVYYAGAVQNEDVDHLRFFAYQPRDILRQRLGLTYKKRRFSAGIEYEYNDDSIDPYQAGHANTSITLYESLPHVVTASGRISYFDYDGERYLESHDATLADIGLAWRAAIAQDFDLNASVAYRFENSSLYGRTHGLDARAALERRIGQFTLALEVEYDRLNLPSSDDESYGVWLKLRREFPVIGRAD